MTGKLYPTEVVLSLFTGVLLCQFGDMQELADYLSGESTMTHQFAHRPFMAELKAALRAQHPSLSEADASDVGRKNWEAFRDAQIQRLGASLEIVPMGTTEHFGAAFTEPLKLIGTKR